MPHINRIRVNNVKYNFGTQFYDDFMMRFSGKNTIYDLANGGGKSVLMLLLMQNLIPNCTLDEKQPLEKLFRTNEGSTTIHSLVEWILSDAHIRDNYKYMLTGFCARRAKDNGEEVQRNTAEIEYFNYCIFYRKYNEHDIKNLPLVKDGERITYTGLKNYLKELERTDYNLEVHIFERKGDYQRFISDYGLYESHWEIIRGINKTEGHVRTYFESNYKTTRKVVEDLLIEEIIQKSFHNKYNSGNQEDTMAKTLLDIKDKLLELSKKKEEIHNYDRQMELIDNFSERVQGILKLYIGMESLENELAKAYNTIENAKEQKRQERINVADRRMNALQEKNVLSRRVETAKVMQKSKELNQYKKEIEECQRKIDEQKNAIKEYMDQLVKKECGNDFLDYMGAKAEHDKLKEMLDSAFKDKDTLMTEVRGLVKAKKKMNEERLAEIEAILRDNTELSKKEQTSYEESTEAVKSLDHDITILEFRVQEEKANKEKMLSDLERARGEAGILIPATASEQMKSKQLQLTQYENSREELKSELQELEQKRNSFFYEKQKYIENEKRMETEIEWLDKKLKESDELTEKAHSICNVYGESDTDILQKKIHSSVNDKVCAVDGAKKAIEKLEKQFEAAKSGKAFTESESVKNILDYIERYHGDDAVSGIEYLKDVKEDEREELLWRIPILPYGIVVFRNFEQIISDGKLKELRTGHEAVAFINYNSIKRDEIISNADNIFYLMDKEEILQTPEQWQQNVKVMESDINKAKAAYERQTETLAVMEEDYEFIARYNVEKKQWQNIQSDCEEKKLEYKKIVAEREKLESEGSTWINSIDSINVKIAEMDEKIEGISKEIESAGNVNAIYKEISLVEKKLQDDEKKLSDCGKERDDLAQRVAAMDNQMTKRRLRMQSIQQEIMDIKNEWENKYSAYDSETATAVTGLSETELNAKLDGALEAIMKENSNLEDRHRLLKNYKSSMEKAAQRISYQGYSVDAFDEMYKNHEIFESTQEELSKLKESVEQLQQALSKLEDDAKKKTSTKDKMEGHITNAIQVISEKYGFYEEESINADDISIFITENAEILAGYETEIARADNLLKSIDEAINSYLMIGHTIESRIELEGIKVRDSEEVFDSGINIEEKCQEILKKYEQFRNSVAHRREDFTREKQMLIDTMKVVSGEALADEISRNIEMPSSFEETEQLIKMMAETVSCLELEKERVGKGIEDMEKIKENFESQCLQNCLNIKTELERLPKLSTIVMDGEKISIISLKIPYKKEEMYEAEMSDYIDYIAEKTDGLATEEERIKYIRNQLSWKKLFSVIVTDMNAIKLNLYKRERIKEQSRYLPYEEAVGSTGQSQGIYIQFLIAVINYISSINSRNADASRLRKVIFLDNPFGAAKDVYIWEPIFKLLKTNNVQLIVPARGATPAITGRFDVNYVLGQKMSGKRQQTVVVDYFSNVENEEMEYTTLNYEQLHFDNTISV